MPRGERYDPAVREKIIAAVKEARAKGEKFDAQYEAAKAAGYKGKPASLRVLISSAGLTKRRGRKRGPKPGVKRGPGRPPKAAVAKRGPGRPPKVAAKRGPGRPPKAAAAKNGLGEIDAIIRREVSVRINAAVDAAIEALKYIKIS